MTTNPFVNARSYLAVHGWCKYKLKDDTGRVCLLGAYTMANSMSMAHSPGDMALLSKACRTLYPHASPLLAPHEFNDQLLSTQEDADRVLEYAAKLWDYFGGNSASSG